MKIYWATKLRGFLREISYGLPSIEFIDNGRYFERKSNLARFVAGMVKLRFINFTGIFQVIRVREQDCDIYGSFNRFLNTDKPYFIYLETPTALYHYTLGRNKGLVGRKRFEACMHDENLKEIICMNHICQNTFEKMNGPIPENVKMTTIYPLVRNNHWVNEEIIHKKSWDTNIECLYCVQGIHFTAKGGLEVLDAVDRVYRRMGNIHLTVITTLKDVDKNVLRKMENTRYITLRDFSFSYDELEKIYAATAILLQPTSIDSAPSTILESMKGGAAIIASDLFAIPEMVIDGYNGYIVEPQYRYYDKDGIPNPSVWNHTKRTVYSGKKSKILTDVLVEKIEGLLEDRNRLEELCRHSWELSRSERFDENVIRAQWERLLYEIVSNKAKHE